MTRKTTTLEAIELIFELEKAKPWMSKENIEMMEIMLSIVPISEIDVDEDGEICLTDLGHHLCSSYLEKGRNLVGPGGFDWRAELSATPSEQIH